MNLLGKTPSQKLSTAVEDSRKIINVFEKTATELEVASSRIQVEQDAINEQILALEASKQLGERTVKQNTFIVSKINEFLGNDE